MQIKLYGNGHSCNIPVQEIIDKYWKDETAPFSFEMSTAIGDETIAATAMLGEENPDTYPSIRLDSRNARKDSSATWFILETPNETNPYVTGYAYAGNDETEGDSWITKIVDVPRDDDFVCYTHKTKGAIIHGMLERYLQRIKVADFLR